MHQSFATTSPLGPGIAGLKYRDFTFEVCREYARLLIPAKTAGEIAVRFYWDIVQSFDRIFADI